MRHWSWYALHFLCICSDTSLDSISSSLIVWLVRSLDRTSLLQWASACFDNSDIIASISIIHLPGSLLLYSMYIGVYRIPNTLWTPRTSVFWISADMKAPWKSCRELSASVVDEAEGFIDKRSIVQRCDPETVLCGSFGSLKLVGGNCLSGLSKGLRTAGVGVPAAWTEIDWWYAVFVVYVGLPSKDFFRFALLDTETSM